MSKLTKTYFFDEVSERYFLKTYRSAGFMEPYIGFQLIEKDFVPRGALVQRVKLKYAGGYDFFDLKDLQRQFESLSIDDELDIAGKDSGMDISES